MSKTKMPPEYWVEYRKKNKERLNAQSSLRRKNASPEKKRARHVATAEWRKRKRAAEAALVIPELHTGHELFDKAREIYKKRGGRFLPTGSVYKFERELDTEDALSDIVLSLLSKKKEKKWQFERFKVLSLDSFPEDSMARFFPFWDKAINLKGTQNICHPDKKHYGRGLCRDCHDVTHNLERRFKNSGITREEVTKQVQSLIQTFDVAV